MLSTRSLRVDSSMYCMYMTRYLLSMCIMVNWKSAAAAADTFEPKSCGSWAAATSHITHHFLVMGSWSSAEAPNQKLVHTRSSKDRKRNHFYHPGFFANRVTASFADFLLCRNFSLIGLALAKHNRSPRFGSRGISVRIFSRPCLTSYLCMVFNKAPIIVRSWEFDGPLGSRSLFLVKN